jgi:hypothetical protein
MTVAVSRRGVSAELLSNCAHGKTPPAVVGNRPRAAAFVTDVSLGTTIALATTDSRGRPQRVPNVRAIGESPKQR